MRQRLMLLLVPLALVAASCSGGGATDVALGTEVHGVLTTNAEGVTVSPNFTLTLATGALWTLEDQGNPTILLFWADW